MSHSSLNNEFFAKACQEWRDQLCKGEFTQEAVQRNKLDSERDRLKLDPWKAKHFEPIWGLKRDYSLASEALASAPDGNDLLVRKRKAASMTMAMAPAVDARPAVLVKRPKGEEISDREQDRHIPIYMEGIASANICKEEEGNRT